MSSGGIYALGNEFLARSVRSLMWKVPWVVAFAKALHLYEVDVDQREYGAASMKPI